MGFSCAKSLYFPRQVITVPPDFDEDDDIEDIAEVEEIVDLVDDDDEDSD